MDGTTAIEEPSHVDVLIIGAGLSGIGAGYHLQANSPDRTYLILEGRDAIGGTWDLFRYPGVRSDSDMYTLGYSFRPWRGAKAIADGPSILAYIRDTATKYGVDRHIRFGHRVVRAAWSSEAARWTVEAEQEEAEHGTERRRVAFTCNFLFGCGGYYAYENGYLPEFRAVEAFRGRIVHPQHWPEDLDYAGKRVVVIGSGATAVTLVPAMAETAAHVVMLQRSPTYIVARPSEDALANKLNRRLPPRLAYAVTRWRNVLRGMYFYRLARREPERVKAGIIAMARAALGPGYDVETHFTPRYKPWDQRLCLIPDGDLFNAIKDGRASVVTDEIDSFTPDGLLLRSGTRLDADIIITATGLNMEFLSGVTVEVDGARVDFTQAFCYKGMMYSDVPNLATSFGYTNASWTLKSDLTAQYVCRLLNYMRRNRFDSCTPYRDPAVAEAPWLDFTSGYVQRALKSMPKQGTQMPWKLHQNYARDILALRFGKVADRTMRFARAAPASTAGGSRAGIEPVGRRLGAAGGG